MKNCHHFHRLNSIELLVRGDTLLSNHDNQHLDITYQPWIFCHVMFTKVSITIIHKMTHNQVSIGLLYSTFLLTITFRHVSPNPMAIPKLFFTRLEEKDQNNIWKKNGEN